MFAFSNSLIEASKEVGKASRSIGQGYMVTFDHIRRRPVTVQYPYEKLIPTERFRGRIHFEFDKCIACEVCVRVCPINLPVVDWDYKTEIKKKQLTVEIDWEQSAIEASKDSWKDELWSIVFVLILAANLVPSLQDTIA